MNFLGIDVTRLDGSQFVLVIQLAGALLYLAWVGWMWRADRIRAVWMPVLLALLCWFVATFPLQRVYGLRPSSDRVRNLWWCATAAAGNPPWESGVVGQSNLEPAWSSMVALLTGFEPSRVIAIYPYLPALAIILVGLSFALAFRKRSETAALLVLFFLLLAPTAAIDFVNPFRGFWPKLFLLKPNHALGLALVPLFVSLVAATRTPLKSLGAALVLGLMGWIFVVHWALVCGGLTLFGVWTLAKEEPERLRELSHLALIGLGGALIAAPYLYYLVSHFPVVSFAPGGYAEDPLRSVWGDTPPRTHSLLFLVTFDLGLNFILALYGSWSVWRDKNRFELMWLFLLVTGYAAWTFNTFMLSMGRGRQTDELYYFVVILTAVMAGIGLSRLSAVLPGSLPVVGTGERRLALVLALWLPLSLTWWWDPYRMDAHFRLALEPIPAQQIELADWLREHSRGNDVVLAGGEVAHWIPALSGRRIRFLEELDDAAGAVVGGEARYIVTDGVFEAGRELDVNPIADDSSLELIFESADLRVYGLREREARGPAE